MIRFIPVFYLLIVLVSCNNETSSEYTINPPDSTKPELISKTQFNAYPAIFQAAFINRSVVKQYGNIYSFYSYNLGTIKIESGKIIASDPITMRDGQPFAPVFPIGEFPVNLAIAEIKNDERVAFSRILFSTDTISKWEPALLEGQKAFALEDSNIHCYGVDAGMGLFIDSIANKAFDKKEMSVWKEAFISKSSGKDYKGHIYEFDNHNVAAFNTGFGDGCYPSNIGYNSKGDICQLLTDFNMIDWWTIKK